MEYIFRNKNIDCFSFEYNEKNREITNIKQLSGYSKLPQVLKSESSETVKHYLFFYRPLPFSRPNFKNMFLQSIDIMELYNRNLGLNLDDTYWLVNENNAHLKWEEVNYFYNFSNDCSNDMIEKKCKLLVSNKLIKYRSPDFFTNGELLKTWIEKDGEKYLLKDNSYFSKTIPMQEIYAEYFAWQVASYLLLNVATYDIEKFNNKIVNSSKIFTSENVSFLPLFTLINNNWPANILIPKIKEIYGKEQFEDLMVFDALIFNVDRHLGNFGILIDPIEFKKITNAPIFDNGKSLIYDFNIYKGKIGQEYIENYASISTKLYRNFDVQLSENIQKRHIRWLNALIDFEFKNHPIFHAKRNYFLCVKKIFRKRIKQAIEIYNTKFNK